MGISAAGNAIVLQVNLATTSPESAAVRQATQAGRVKNVSVS